MMRSTMYRNLLRHLKKPAILLVWLFLWQLGSLLLGQEILLVSPVKTVETLLILMWTPDFWYSIGTSLLRIMGGFLLALLTGSVLAFCGWRVPFIHEFLSPLLNVMKATPVASFIILALLWVNGAYISVLCSFIMGMPIVYSNLYAGLCNIDKKLLEVGQVFALPQQKMVQQIYIPSLKPYLLSACTICIGFCWKSGVAAEVIGLANHTIGMHLYNAKVYLETPELFAWTLVIILLSVSIEKWMVRISHKILH